MNNANFLAQAGHFLWGFGSVVAVAYALGRGAALMMFGLNVLYASVKEWIYDANFELPKQTWKDNLLDFSMYAVGCTAGLLYVFFIPRYILFWPSLG